MKITISKVENGFVIEDNAEEPRTFVVETDSTEDAKVAKALFYLIWEQWFYKSKHNMNINIQLIGSGGEVLDEDS